MTIKFILPIFGIPDPSMRSIFAEPTPEILHCLGEALRRLSDGEPEQFLSAANATFGQGELQELENTRCS